MIEITQKEECKEIIDKFNDLMPWDKGDLMRYIADNIMTEDEIFEYFIKGTGYVYYDDIDVVKEVIDQGYEREVLDDMYEEDICEYLLDSCNAAENVMYMVDKISKEDAAELLSKLNTDSFIEALDIIKLKYKDEYKKIIEHITGL